VGEVRVLEERAWSLKGESLTRGVFVILRRRRRRSLRRRRGVVNVTEGRFGCVAGCVCCCSIVRMVGGA
jgi:hypothetical protein